MYITESYKILAKSGKTIDNTSYVCRLKSSMALFHNGGGGGGEFKDREQCHCGAQMQ